MKKTLVILVIGALAAAAGWQIYKRASAGTDKGPRRRSVAVAVEVAGVRKAAIPDIGDFSGSLIPKSTFVAAAKIAGRLEKLLVNLGDPVRRGQVIAVLDDEEFAQQVEQARAELDVTKANVDNCTSDLEAARAEFARTKALRDKKIASDSEYEAEEAKYKACQAKQKVAQAQVAQKAAALKAAQIRLSYTKVQAFWDDGDEPRIVAERFVDAGALLKANDPIVSIIEDRVVTAVIYVIERDYPKVRAGQAATVTTDAHPGRSFTGRVVRIGPLLEETSRQGRVEIEIPNPDRLLRAGYFVRAKIEFALHEGATAVPVGALVKRDNRQGVFLADPAGRKATFVPVTVGVVSGELAEIVKPALAGQVVTLGHHLLEDGSAILLPAARRPGTQPAGRGATTQSTTRGAGRGASR